MKTEINNTTKAMFFALYWGQEVAKKVKVFYPHNIGEIDAVNGHVIETITNITKLKYRLELKPLESITDEDALNVSRINQSFDNLIGIGTDAEIRYARNNIHFLVHKTQTADFMRSKGYTIDWMGLSVEEMENAGWITLKS